MLSWTGMIDFDHCHQKLQIIFDNWTVDISIYCFSATSWALGKRLFGAIQMSYNFFFKSLGKTWKNCPRRLGPSPFLVLDMEILLHSMFHSYRIWRFYCTLISQDMEVLLYSVSHSYRIWRLYCIWCLTANLFCFHLLGKVNWSQFHHMRSWNVHSL